LQHAFSDLDIEEIIKTFAREQESLTSSAQHQPADDNSLKNHIGSWSGEEIGLTYEPIYGFGGSASNDLYFGFEGRLE
jgi:hypothetical protein